MRAVDDFESEGEGGSMVGCELQEQLAAAQNRTSEAEGKLEQVAEQQEKRRGEETRRENGWRAQLDEARRKTEAAGARAERSEGEIAGWQVAVEEAVKVAGEVSEMKEVSKAAEKEAVKMVAVAQARWQVAEEEAAASEARAQVAEAAAVASAAQARHAAWQAQVTGERSEKRAQEIRAGGSRVELERSAMEREDA